MEHRFAKKFVLLLMHLRAPTHSLRPQKISILNLRILITEKLNATRVHIPQFGFKKIEMLINSINRTNQSNKLHNQNI
jgi:hypothetical protein